MKKTTLFLFAFFSMFFVFAQSDKQMEKQFLPDCIPSDILKKDYVLLVKIPYDNNKLVSSHSDAFQEGYTGSFEVVSFKTSIPENYTDIKKYRYVIIVGHAFNKKEFPDAKIYDDKDPDGRELKASWAGQIYILDRKENKVKFTGLDGQNTQKLIGFLAKKLSGL